MKRILMLIAVAILAVPMFVSAAEVKMSENIGVNESPNNLYVSGQNPTIDAGITGDLVVAGGNVTINGDVEKNVIAAGGNVSINGSVGENVRVAGGGVTINGAVEGDLIIFAGDVLIENEATIAGDVIIYAGSLELKGQVDGDIKNSGVLDVTISGLVVGDVDLGTVDQLTIKSGAEIDGTLKYSASSEFKVPTGATIGKVDFTKATTRAFGIDWLGILLSFISMVIISLVFAVLLPKFTKNVIDNSVAKPWLKFLVGLGTLVVVPIVFILLLIVSIVAWGVGIELASYVVIAYAVSLSLAETITALFVGSLAWKYFMKEDEYVVNWKNALIGVAIVTVLSLIPFVGFIPILIVACTIFGALTSIGFNYLKAQKA